MRSRRFAPVLLSCAAVVLAGCGGSSLLDGDSASDLQASLSKVRTAIDDGQCDRARTAAASGAAKVDQLPSDVDADLRDNLKTAFEDLSARVETDCEDTSSQPTSTTEPATPTTETTDTTEPATPTTEPDEPTDPEPTTTDPEPTDPTTTGGVDPTTPTEPDDDSGGVTPGVDGPAAGERSVPGASGAAQGLRQKLRDARKHAERYFHGRGPG